MAATSNRLSGLREHLLADVLCELLRAQCERISDSGDPGAAVRPANSTMAALAMFAVPYLSLLEFGGGHNGRNLQYPFRSEVLAGDWKLREVLNFPSSTELLPLFAAVFREPQRRRVLGQCVFHRRSCLLSLGGTKYFSSQKIHCPSCPQKSNEKTGGASYYDQILEVVLLHPSRREVIPLATEPAQVSDGNARNERNRNAGGRLPEQIRKELPHLECIAAEDGLASNASQTHRLQVLLMQFTASMKPGDHQPLVLEVRIKYDDGLITALKWQKTGVRRNVDFANRMRTNGLNPDLLVSCMISTIHGPSGNIQARFTWTTNLEIPRIHTHFLACGSCCRWKFAIAIFTAPQREGYRKEIVNSSGDGRMSVVFASQMMLALLTEPVRKLCHPFLKKVCAKLALCEEPDLDSSTFSLDATTARRHPYVFAIAWSPL